MRSHGTSVTPTTPATLQVAFLRIALAELVKLLQRHVVAVWETRALFGVSFGANADLLELAMSAFTRRDVSREILSSGKIQTKVRRSLDFLRVIEATVDAAGADVQFLQMMTREVNSLLDQLKEAKPENLLDPEGRAGELLRLAAEGALRMYEHSKSRRLHARADGALNDEDGVVECLDQLIAALADYHNAIETLCDTIETLDAVQSPVIGTYTNAKDLIAALRA